MTIKINDKEIGLKVSMWLWDEDRMTNKLNEKPKSIIWKYACFIYMPYLNFCRHAKTKPELEMEDIELYVDDQWTTKEGKENMIRIVDELSAAFNALNDTDEEKKTIPETVQTGTL